MPDETIHLQGKPDVDVDRRFFEEGPDPDRSVEFFAMDHAQRVQEWQNYLQAEARTINTLWLARAQLRAAERKKLPAAPNRHYQRIYAVSYTAADGTTREMIIEPHVFESGPRTRDGHPVDLRWSVRTATDNNNGDFSERSTVWENYLAATNGEILFDLARSHYDSPDSPFDAGGRLEVEADDDDKRMGALAIGGIASLVVLLLAGIGAAAAGGVGGYSRPEDVTATPGTNSDGATVTVSWTDSTKSAASYSIRLTDKATNATYEYTAGPDDRSVVCTKVPPDATYVVSVTKGPSPASTVEVRVPKAQVPVNTAKPPAPTNVTTTADQKGTPTVPPTITVTWDAVASTTTSPVDGYRVMLRNADTMVAPQEHVVAADVTVASFPLRVPGTWTAVVVATNGEVDSSESSAPPQSFDPTTGVVAKPRNIRFVPYFSAALATASMVVRWDRPATGNWVDTYEAVVTRTGVAKPVASVSMLAPVNFLQVPGTPDGTYSVTVTAYNAGKTSSAVETSMPFVLKATDIPAGAFDWDLYFSTALRDRWLAANDPNKLNEATIWKNISDVVNDTANQYGGAASPTSQFRLAVLMSSWIQNPIDPPLNLDAIADALADSTTPPFPKEPLKADQPHPGNADALWVAAQGLKDHRGVVYPLRFRILAVERVLERYVGPGTRRAYDLTAVPPDTITALAGVTAQRIDIHVSGRIIGVWFYRVMPEKAKPNTVLVWDTAGTLLSSAVATPSPDTSGWTYLALPSALPVVVPTGATPVQFIVGVYHPTGSHARGATEDGGATLNGRTVGTATLSVPADTAAAPNGLYSYDPTTPTFPTLTYQSAEYFITPEFVAT